MPVVVRALTMQGIRVDEAKNGEKALHLYCNALSSGTPYGLVILDLTDPGCTGALQTLQALREIDPGVRAIVSRGYVSDPFMEIFRDRMILRPGDQTLQFPRSRCHAAERIEIVMKPGMRWARQGSNLRPEDYESPALTN